MDGRKDGHTLLLVGYIEGYVCEWMDECMNVIYRV